jgi:nicotinamide riboside kinase
LFRKIVITGPESTGKSTISEALANHYQCNWIKEYAREYLQKLNKPYTLNDVLEMAKMQLHLEKNISVNNKEFIFLDTDLTVYKIWIKEKYNTEIDWINEEIKNSTHKLFLLCNIDLPWTPDPLREHPNLIDRQRIFKNYIQLLKENNFNYHIVSGRAEERLKNSIQYITNQK